MNILKRWYQNYNKSVWYTIINYGIYFCLLIMAFIMSSCQLFHQVKNNFLAISRFEFMVTPFNHREQMIKKYLICGIAIIKRKNIWYGLTCIYSMCCCVTLCYSMLQVPFREAHGLSGKAVFAAESQNIALNQLTVENLSAVRWLSSSHSHTQKLKD